MIRIKTLLAAVLALSLALAVPALAQTNTDTATDMTQSQTVKKSAKERYTSAKKSMWPGVSTMLTLHLCHWKEVTAA